MGVVTGILQSIWDIITGIYETLATAANMVELSVDFLAFFVTYLPTVIASGVLIYLAVYVIRFLLLK